MVFTARCLTYDLRIGPSEIAVVVSQRNAGEPSGGGRSAALTDRDLVGNPQRKWHWFPSNGLQNLPVSGQDEVIFELSADTGITASGPDRVLLGGMGFQLQIKIKRQRGSIEGRTEIGRGCGEGDAEQVYFLDWHMEG
jgi:hypothetical protein